MAKKKKTVKKKTAKAVDYSKPLESDNYERFAQEYRTCLNATDAYKVAYPKSSVKTAEVGGCRLLRNVKVACRLVVLQAELSETSGVKAEKLMDELKKIGFSNIKDYVSFNKIKPISQLTDSQAAVIASFTTSKAGSVTIKLYDKLDAIEKMCKRIGFYAENNKQLAESLAELFKRYVE